MEAKTKKDLTPIAKKLMNSCDLKEVYATPQGEFYSNPETAKVVYGEEIEVYTFTKVKK